jgi:hypothetical protein
MAAFPRQTLAGRTPRGAIPYPLDRCASAVGSKIVRACALLLASALLVACGGDPASPEERIGALIDAMEQAVEAGSVEQAAELLHPNYRDDIYPNKSAAMRMLAAYLRRHSGIHLFSVVDTIDLAPDGAGANAVIYVAMSGVAVDSVETLARLRADLYRFDVELGLLEGDWRVLHGRWERADIAMLQRGPATSAH